MRPRVTNSKFRSDVPHYNLHDESERARESEERHLATWFDIHPTEGHEHQLYHYTSHACSGPCTSASWLSTKWNRASADSTSFGNAKCSPKNSLLDIRECMHFTLQVTFSQLLHFRRMVEWGCLFHLISMEKEVPHLIYGKDEAQQNLRLSLFRASLQAQDMIRVT